MNGYRAGELTSRFPTEELYRVFDRIERDPRRMRFNPATGTRWRHVYNNNNDYITVMWKTVLL